MLRLGVLVSGGGTNLQAVIEHIADGRIRNAEIKLVISNNHGAYAIERARKNHIPCKCLSPKKYETREAFHEALIQSLEEAEIDLIVLAGFMVVLPERLIVKYRNRIINVHPSLIPSFCGTGYYGLEVHKGALKRAVKITGATVHFVDEGTDTGPIIIQKAVEVKEDDTPESLQLRVMQEAEWVIMPKAIDLIASGKILVIDGKVIVKE